MPVTDPVRRREAMELGLDPDLVDFIPDQPASPAAPAPSSTAAGAAFRSAKRAALPTAVGIGATALAAAPFTGGTSLLGLLVPLGAGLGAGALTAYGQEKLDPLTEEEQAQRAIDVQQHPYATIAGELAPSLAAFRPSFRNIATAFRSLPARGVDDATRQAILAQRLNVGLGAGVGGIQETVLPLARGEEISPARLAGAVLGGGLISEPHGVGRLMGFRPSALQPTLRPEREPLQLPAPRRFEAGPEGVRDALAPAPKLLPAPTTYDEWGQIALPAGELPVIEAEVVPTKLAVVTGEDGLPSVRPVEGTEVTPSAKEEVKGQEVLTPETGRAADQLPLAPEAPKGPAAAAEVPAPVAKPPVSGVEKAPEGAQPTGAAPQRAIQQAVTPAEPAAEGPLEFFAAPGERLDELAAARAAAEAKVQAILAKYNGQPDTPEIRHQMETEASRTMTMDELLANPRNRKLFDVLQKLAAEKQITVGVARLADALGLADLKKRVVALNPDNLGKDTLGHEITHILLKDMMARNDRLASRGLALFGGDEERLVQALGMSLTDLAERGVTGLTLKRFQEWVRDFLAAIKNWMGKANAEDIKRLLARRILYGDIQPAPYLPKPGESPLRYQEMEARATVEHAPMEFVRKYAAAPLDMWLPEIEKIRRDIPQPHGAVVADSITEAFRAGREFQGIGYEAIAAAKTLSAKEQAAALEYFNRKQDTRNATDTNAPEKVLRFEELLRERFYHRWAEAAKANGKMIVEDGKGRPIFEVPWYHASMMRPDVQDHIVRGTEQGQRYARMQQEWMAQQTGKSVEEVVQDWQKWGKAHYTGQGEGHLEYGPLSEPAGVGVAPALREDNLVRLLERYNFRAARALGFHKAIHNNPRAAWLLGIDKDQLGQTIPRPDDIPPTQMRYGGHPRVTEVMNLLRGDYSSIDRRIDTLNSVVRAGMLQTLTGLTDLMSFYVHTMPYTAPKQVIPAALHALRHARDGIRAGFRTGVIQAKQLQLETGRGMEGFGKVQAYARSLADGLNVITGRNHLEQWSRGLTMAWSDFLVKSNLGHAFNGNKRAADFLNRFAGGDWRTELLPLVQRGEGVPQEVIDRIAANVTEAAQGTYDPRGLPIQALRGHLSPWLSLAKWNIEKMNEFRRSVIGPAKRGNFGPLITTTMGAFVAGSSIEAMREWITGRKPQNATWEEVFAAGGEGLEYRLMALASYAGWGGFAMEALKQVHELKHGKRAMGLRFPAMAMAQAFFERVGQSGEAIAAGENPVETLFVKLPAELVKDNIQMGRVLLTRGDVEELNRVNALRDLRVFRELEGQPARTTRERRNPFLHALARRYQESQDPAEIMGLAPQLTELAFERGGGDLERTGSLLRTYRTSGSDLMPSLRARPMEFGRYADWLGRTQGQGNLEAALQGYFQKEALDQFRAGLVPRL